MFLPQVLAAKAQITVQLLQFRSGQLVMAEACLLGKKLGNIVVLAPPMLTKLPAMFTWPQLFTALIGGAVALLLVPVLRKALHK